MRKLFEERVAEILKETVDLPIKKVIIHKKVFWIHLVKTRANDMHKTVS